MAVKCRIEVKSRCQTSLTDGYAIITLREELIMRTPLCNAAVNMVFG